MCRLHYDMKVIRENNFSYLSQYSNLAKINDDATMYVAKNGCMLDRLIDGRSITTYQPTAGYLMPEDRFIF